MVNTFTLEDVIKAGKYSKDPYPTTTTSTGSGSISGSWAVPGTLVPTKDDTIRRDIVYNLVQAGYWVKATGSRVTKDGFTKFSDWDFVIFDPDNALFIELTAQGWTDNGSGAANRQFASLRLGEVNLILTKEEAQWKKWIIATNLIKALNCKTKPERIKVFDSVFGTDSNADAVTF